jgi:hypothetical protein
MAAKKKSPKKPQERNLTRELAALLAKTLLPDLEARAKEPSVARALAAQYESEKKHTADKLAEWITRTLEQVAVAWILSCVFIRTLEDRGYLTHPRIAGEGAADSEHLFFDLFPSLTQRDYLLAVFRELSHLPGGEDVLGPQHNPAWRLAPSTETVRALLAFFREANGEGQLVWTFAGESTRFLGDLYQDVSEAVRERYALLQTPEFVEEFILDLTLDPAIAEFGLEDVRLLDPTCGSGHFLLGAFKRLFEARQHKAPGVPAKEHAASALAQVYGVDINPYAAAIARFRLVLAYLHAAEVDKLKNAPRVPTNVVVADSLRFAANKQTLPFAAVAEDAMAWGEGSWQLEDPKDAQRTFAKKFHAVVGNPPYITCKDAKLREEYRAAYKSAAGKYALSAPFTERFFQLAIDGGFVGMINANSFMKREFGKALIEKVLPAFELTRVMDTSGAYIPGHGTPTVLLFGRNRTAISDTIVAVLGKRGEPGVPAAADKGAVWSSIRDHFDEIGFENEYVSVARATRDSFERHPWSVGGGGASELKQHLEQRAVTTVGELALEIGPASFTGLDDLFIHDVGVLKRHRIPERFIRPVVLGENIRNWSISCHAEAFAPYDNEYLPELALQETACAVFLWPLRTTAENVTSFGGRTRKDEGEEWWQWYRWIAKRYQGLRLAFADVATHNHFVLERGGRAFNRTAPVIKLPASESDSAEVALAGYLNCSIVEFFVRQVAHNKGAQGINEGIKSEAWEQFLARNAATIEAIPVPAEWESLAALGRQLEDLAASRAKFHPQCLTLDELIDPDASARIRAAESQCLERMVAAQEHLDWAVYRLFGLVSGECPERRDAIAPGDRIFEQMLSMKAGSTRWFESNNYRRPSIGSQEGIQDKALELLETPATKRRWTMLNWDEEAELAIQGKVADELEKAISCETRAVRVEDLFELGRRHAGVVFEKALNALSETDGGIELVQRAAVPFLACFRHSEAGLSKRHAWERVWDLQRREDAGATVVIAAPPKYDSKDYRDHVYWRLRGKLDVPKERFISYPGAEKDDDKSPLLGWAGWDYLQRATALAGLYHERKTEDGWPPTRLMPLLGGLLELIPWLKQWHNQPNDELGGEGPGDWYERYVEAESRFLGKSIQELRDWRPATGRKPGK